MFSKLNDLIFPGHKEYPKIKTGQALVLGFQHAFAMSCATILVPILTGLDIGVALLAAGVGTLIFHICTRGKMPTFLGSSFAFIGALCGIIGNNEFGATKSEQISAACGGIIAAGLVYVILALIIKLVGSKFIEKLIPPVVRGVGIAIIGLSLSTTAISNIQHQVDSNGNSIFEMFSPGYYWNWGIALFVLLIAILLSCYGKGMIKQSSIVISLVAGYLLTLIVTQIGLAPATLMSFGDGVSTGLSRNWFEVPNIVLPSFNLKAIAMIAPISIVTCVEHLGDVYANGAVVGRDFTKDPGLHKTMLGDGLATIFAGCIGGPANTTYSENTAVLAATGNYNPVTLRIAAVVAIFLSFFGKGIGIIESVPSAVLGGACILLYGMISSVGLRTLVSHKVDFTKNRNLSIAAVMLVLAIGGAVIGGPDFSLSGIGLSIIAGIIINLILPEAKVQEHGKGIVPPSGGDINPAED